VIHPSSVGHSVQVSKSTPLLSDWIRHAKVAGYVTAHELLPTETALFGTETLYGDWSGQTLLLAKDFAPSIFVRERIAQGDGGPTDTNQGCARTACCSSWRSR
jgi:hypothetical protein